MMEAGGVLPSRGDVAYQNFPSWDSRYQWSLQTIDKLAFEGAYHPDIRNYAVDVVAHCPARDYTCEVGALFEAVRSDIRFVRDPVGMEWIQRPEWTLHKRAGDCDCQVTLLGSMLRSLGYPVRFVTGKRPGVPLPEHVWIEVKVKDRWLTLDPTWGGAGPLPKGIKKTEVSGMETLMGLEGPQPFRSTFALSQGFDVETPYQRLATDPRFDFHGRQIHFFDYADGLLVIVVDDPQYYELGGFWSAFKGIFKTIGKGIWKGVKSIFKIGKGEVTGDSPWEKFRSALMALAAGTYIFDDKCGVYYDVVKDSDGLSLRQVSSPPKFGAVLKASTLPWWVEDESCTGSFLGIPVTRGSTVGVWFDKYKFWLLGGGLGAVLLFALVKRRRR